MAAASGTVASTTSCPVRERVLEVGQGLRLVAEWHAEDHHISFPHRLRVLEPVERAARELRRRPRRGLLGAPGIAGADHDRDAGLPEPQGEPESQGAGATDDADGV